MKSFHNLLIIEKKRLVAELKELTGSKTAKDLTAAIQIWRHYYDEVHVKNTILGNEKLVLRACKSLRLDASWSTGVKLFASLNKFNWLYGRLQYLDVMFKAHEAGLELIPDYTPGMKLKIPNGFGVSEFLIHSIDVLVN